MNACPKLRDFIAIALFICCPVALAYAEEAEKKAGDSPSKPASIEITPEIEGHGLYEKPADGNPGTDIWRDTPRSYITRLIAAMPVKSRYESMQKIIFGILLSKTQTGLLESDIPIETGRDLLTLRLEKLIEAGAYRQALDLYSSLPDKELGASTTRAGILAMLFRGEKSLACLELNSVQESYGANDFFKTLGAYCNASLSEKPDEKSLEMLKVPENKLLLSLASDKALTVTYTPAFFSKYSLLEKAMIAAEGRLRLSASHDSNFRDVPPQDIQILQKIPNLTPEELFILDVRAVESGLLTATEFTKIYKAAIDPDLRLDPELKIPEKAEDWQKLPYLLQLATNKKADAEKWAYIRESFALGKKYGFGALIPFAELIYKVTPPDPTLPETMTAVKILNRGGFKIPRQWAEIINKYQVQQESSATLAALLAASYLSDPDGREESLKKLHSLSNLPENYVFLVDSVIENIDKQSKSGHTLPRVYENNLDLTIHKDYVMPSKGVWNRLLEAPQEGHVGETILLSAIALQETPLGSIYPGLFQDVLKSLKSVGLTDIADDMAIAAVLGDTED